MITIQKLHAEGLSIPRFHAAAGEGWCIIGANASGVDRFCDILAEGGADCTYEQLEVPAETGVLTFKQQQALFEEEVRNDNTDFMDRIDPGTPAARFITNIDQHLELIAACNMSASLNKGYRQLSSGQSRKLCLLREISRGIRCLIVQNPYEGIDPESCRDLDRLFLELRRNGIMVVVTVNNFSDIGDWCSHVAAVRDGELHLQGAVAETLPKIAALFAEETGDFTVSPEELRRERQELEHAKTGKVLVRLCNGFAGYGEDLVFTGVNLSVTEGQHTLITGPNGCGKSTLLQLITGDHPLCYRNDLQVFGWQRGSGESIWEIKRDMGMVSSELHRSHYIPGSSLHVLLSGLFDSIGLYRQPTRNQQQLAGKWLRRLGMIDKARQPFRQLTYAEQRLLLIGRALIKVPRLLILDEPTHGLDQGNRIALLDLLEEIAGENICTLLYVSHRQDEYRPFFKQHLIMGK